MSALHPRLPDGPPRRPVLSSARPAGSDPRTLGGNPDTRWRSAPDSAPGPGSADPFSVRPPRARATTRPANAVTAEEMARAAELEAAILAEEQIAADVPQEPRPPDEDAGRRHGDLLLEPLADARRQEYGYVQRDLRRIAIVGGGLLIVLVVIDVLLNVAHVF